MHVTGGGEAVTGPAAEEASPTELVAKKLKKLKKTLKAIEGIEEKVAAGAEINADQRAKLDTKEDVIADIAAAEADLS